MKIVKLSSILSLECNSKIQLIKKYELTVAQMTITTHSKLGKIINDINLSSQTFEEIWA